METQIRETALLMCIPNMPNVFCCGCADSQTTMFVKGIKIISVTMGWLELFESFNP